MAKENELIPFNEGLETVAKMTWQQFIDRTDELQNKLCSMYDESPVERRKYSRGVCNGGFNFGKTVCWVVDYSARPEALESIASALEAIAKWSNAGSMAWEMRRFIKGSSMRGYNNVRDVVEFGNLIKKIGDDDPTNGKNFQLDMDFFYWDSCWGIDGESTDEEILQAHCSNIAGVINGLERFAHPEIIDADPIPTKDEDEAREKEEREQYWKDFLADARHCYQHPSLFDILDTEELITRPYHKIVTYPAGFCEIVDSSVLNPAGYSDINDAVLAFYRYSPYMTVKRADQNWFPSPLPADYTDFYREKFEKRLKRTLEKKPWLIDFSVKWQDVLERSFMGGNHGDSHAGEVELVYKNPRYISANSNLFNHEYEWRRLDPEEEKLFFESVADIQSLADLQPPVEPPTQSWVFNGQTGRPYLFKLTDGREFNIFLKHEYGSLYWEGKVVIIAHNGPEPLFQTVKKLYSDSGAEEGIRIEPITPTE